MKKYYSEIRLFGKIAGPRPMLMPWPMTQLEGWAWIGATTVIWGAGTIFAVWLAVQFMEPSLFRLLPIMIWFLLLRVAVFPLLFNKLKPAGANERVAESGSC